MNKVSLSGPYYLKKSRHKHFFRIMRITSFLLFVLIFSLHAINSSSQNARITVQAHNTTLKDVLNTIEKQTDYLFVYNINEEYSYQSCLSDTDQKVALNTVNQPVKQVLDNLFKNIGLNYVQEGSYIVVSKSEAEQQKKFVTGTVIDMNGEPVIGANIVEKGTTNGIITDVNGEFSLQVSPDAVLQISYIGYNTREVAVNNQSSITIKLTEDTQAIEEIVVVGYGVQKRENLTGAVSAIMGDDLMKRPVGQTSVALQGIAPGVTITQQDKMPEQSESGE